MNNFYTRLKNVKLIYFLSIILLHTYNTYIPLDQNCQEEHIHTQEEHIYIYTQEEHVYIPWTGQRRRARVPLDQKAREEHIYTQEEHIYIPRTGQRRRARVPLDQKAREEQRVLTQIQESQYTNIFTI